MGADVAENAAILHWIPEPVRTATASACVSGVLDDLVRSDIDGLDDAADGSGLDEVACFDGGFDLEALAVHDGVDFFGFGDGFADGGEGFEGGDAGVVAENVFAVLHGAD